MEKFHARWLSLPENIKTIVVTHPKPVGKWTNYAQWCLDSTSDMKTGASPDSESMLQNHVGQQRSDLPRQSYSSRAICLKHTGLRSSSLVAT
jgi:hypothetical protein